MLCTKPPWHSQSNLRQCPTQHPPTGPETEAGTETVQHTPPTSTSHLQPTSLIAGNETKLLRLQGLNSNQTGRSKPSCARGESHKARTTDPVKLTKRKFLGVQVLGFGLENPTLYQPASLGSTLREKVHVSKLCGRASTRRQKKPKMGDGTFQFFFKKQRFTPNCFGGEVGPSINPPL